MAETGRSPARWDHVYDSRQVRPLLRHGYWPVLWSWARRDFHARYSQSALRAVWSIWQPLSIVLVNGIVFYAILGVDGGGLPYLAFIVASIMVFRYLATGLGACSILSDNASILTKASFPREIVPLSTLTVSFVDLGVMLGILVVVSIAQGIHLQATVVALPAVLLLIVLFTVWLTLLLCTLAVFVRDLTYLVPMVSQLLFLGSPIMYPAEKLPARVAWINHVNPLAVTVEGVRDVVLRGTWPPWGLLAVQLVVNGVLVLVALWYLRSVERRMADVV
ncbi:MAG: ABC transporter permease [Acidimicrobiales bacterium]